MATLHLRLAHDPAVLMEAAADGFLRPPAAAESTRAPVADLAGGGGLGDATRRSSADPFPSPDYLLVLRQGGLRDDLLALAARRGVPGWFDPPLCTFAELPKRLGAGALVPLGDFERVALIGSVVRRIGGEVLARLRSPEAYVGALDRFFGELAAERVTPEALEAAQARCLERDDFAVRRDREVAAVYREYLAELAGAEMRDGRDPQAAGIGMRDGRDSLAAGIGMRDGRDSLAACAAAIRADPDALASRLGGRRAIRLLGLQDLRGGWRALLAALRDSPALDEIAIYTSVELELRDLGARVERLAEGDSLATRLFAQPGAPAAMPQDPAAMLQPPAAPAEHALQAPAAPVHVIAAPDAQREVEEVARRVRDLVDAGVAPHRIAVVARDARPQLPMATGALRRFGLPVTVRARTGLAEVPVVRAVLALLDVAAEGWTRHGLVELADQPYLGVELDAGVINTIGYRTRVDSLHGWATELQALLAEAEAREQPKEGGDEPETNGHEQPLPPAWRVQAAIDHFAHLRPRLERLHGARSLKDWVAWLRELVEQDPWRLLDRVYRPPVDRWEVVRLDLDGLRMLGRIAAEWSDALARWGGGEEPLDAGGFAARLRTELRGDVPVWSDTRRGVQVLEGLAAAYRPFEHLFLVGLEAGRFPRRPVRSPLFDTTEREALIAAGLPLDGRAAWESRERELFRSLVAGGRALTVSYARLDAAGREVAASSFVEALGDVAKLQVSSLPVSRVLTPGLPLCPPERNEDAARVARLERRRAAGVACVGNGLVEDLELRAWLEEQFGEARRWSPTQLETFAKCPWSYFAARVLRLEKLEDPDAAMDPKVRGTILHDALKRFYDRLVAEAGGPVLLGPADRDRALPKLHAALDAAIEEAGEAEWLGHPALRAAQTAELRRILARYLDFELELRGKMDNPRTNASHTLRTGVQEHELSFSDVVLERSGVRLRFGGFIDRVEVGIDDRVDDGDVARYVAAVDYKTTRYSTPGRGEKEAWEDGVVLQVPLYAYALSQIWPGSEVARVEYRALKSPDTVHTLELVQVDKAGEVTRPEEAAKKLEAALDAAVAHVARVRQGRFPAEPAESCGCPRWCVGRDICRVPGGPKEK